MIEEEEQGEMEKKEVREMESIRVSVCVVLLLFHLFIDCFSSPFFPSFSLLVRAASLFVCACMREEESGKSALDGVKLKRAHIMSTCCCI